MVVFILGALAGIVIPNFSNLKNHSKAAEAKSVLSLLTQKEQIYFFENAEYTENLNDELNFQYPLKNYAVGFGQSYDTKKQSDKDYKNKLYIGPPAIAPPHEDCQLDKNKNSYLAGSSNNQTGEKNRLKNYTINQNGCLKELDCAEGKYPNCANHHISCKKINKAIHTGKGKTDCL